MPSLADRSRVVPTPLPARSPRSFGRRRSFWTTAGATAVLVVTDWLAVLVCLTVAWAVRHVGLPALDPSYGPLYPLRVYLIDLYLLLPWTIALAQERLYVRRPLFWDEVRHTTRGASLAALFAIFLIYATKTTEEVSRLLLGSVWLATLVVIPLARMGSKLVLLRLGWWQRRLLILGAGVTGRQLLTRLHGRPLLGYVAVGVLDDDVALHGSQVDGVPVLGPVADAARQVRALAVRDVLIAMPRLPHPELRRLVARIEGKVERIHLVPDIVGLTTTGVEAQDLDGALLLQMRWNLARPWSRLVKRFFDVLGAAIAGVVLAPLVLVAGCAVRFDSGPPAFYVQDRLGRRGRPFRCYKLRTMYTDAAARLEAHLHQSETARREWENYAKLKGADPRVTRVGRLLRRFSVDEWPQLYHVLQGAMSLVGPRPYLPSERQQMGVYAQTIFQAQPGMSGLWQVSGRNELTFEQRLQIDEHYVRNWSLWMDIVVLIKTISSVVRGRGAY